MLLVSILDSVLNQLIWIETTEFIVQKAIPVFTAGEVPQEYAVKDQIMLSRQLSKRMRQVSGVSIIPIRQTTIQIQLITNNLKKSPSLAPRKLQQLKQSPGCNTFQQLSPTVTLYGPELFMFRAPLNPP